MIRECIECGVEYDPASPAKRTAGGLITHCPECSDETEVRYLGLRSGDGKGSGVTILKFDSESDREEYREMWHANSGMNVGKSCQMGYLKKTPPVRFKKMYESGLGMNHKGKD